MQQANFYVVYDKYISLIYCITSKNLIYSTYCILCCDLGQKGKIHYRLYLNKPHDTTAQQYCISVQVGSKRYQCRLNLYSLKQTDFFILKNYNCTATLLFSDILSKAQALSSCPWKIVFELFNSHITRQQPVQHCMVSLKDSAKGLGLVSAQEARNIETLVTTKTVDTLVLALCDII